MKNLAYLASLSVLATGIAFAQSAGTAGQPESNTGSSSSAQASPPHQKIPRTDGATNSDPAGVNSSTPAATSPTAQAPVPNATIHDKPAGSGTPNGDLGAAKPRSGTMGTTGKTPEAGTPRNTSPDQDPKSSSTPSNPPPHTSLVAPVGVHHKISPTETLASIARRPPHGPDAGTQPNPEEAEAIGAGATSDLHTPSADH